MEKRRRASSPRAENVRAALIFVARGETPLGIVYQTDAHADKKVRVVAQFPQDTHPAIVYPVAVTAASRHASAASFASFLRSREARAIFERHGFAMER
jgi:molybdate transport system substrate-binding protein